MNKLKISNDLLPLRFQKKTKWIYRFFLLQWVVFLVAILLLVLGSLICYFLISDLKVAFHTSLSFLEHFAIQVVVYGLFFLVFNTYSNITKSSTTAIFSTLFKSSFSSLFTLLLFHYSSLYFFEKELFLVSGLLLYFFLTFFLLISFRLFLQEVYSVCQAFSPSTACKNVIVFGTDATAQDLATILLLDAAQHYTPTAFIAPHSESFSSSTTLHGLPVLDYGPSFFTRMNGLKTSTILLPHDFPSRKPSEEFINACLERGIKLIVAPLASDCENVQEIAKKIRDLEIQDLLTQAPIPLATDTLSKYIKDEVVLVTGAAGFVGRELVRQLLLFHPKTILLLDQAETPLYAFYLELQHTTTSTCVPILADIRDKKQLEFVFTIHRPTLVFHAAAYKHVPLMEGNPIQAVHTNIVGTKNLADLALQYKVLKFVMISTDKAVHPAGIMGASKRIAEQYVQSFTPDIGSETHFFTKFITTRFGNVLDSSGSVIPLFTQQIQAGGPVTVTHHDVTRYFMTVAEACQLVLEAGAMGKGGETFIFDMGQPYRIVDLAEKMIRLAGLVPYKDIVLQFVGMRPGEKLHEELYHKSSKTLPTQHPKIMLCEAVIVGAESMNTSIENLISISERGPIFDLVRAMKVLVPEFKSMNSTFEKLDD